jgi:hypothetical protein
MAVEILRSALGQCAREFLGRLEFSLFEISLRRCNPSSSLMSIKSLSRNGEIAGFLFQEAWLFQ